MHRLLVSTVVLGLAAVVGAVDPTSQGNVAAKVRKGKISFWSDRAFGGRAEVFVMRPDGTPSIWVADADGTNARRIARGGSATWGP